MDETETLAAETPAPRREPFFNAPGASVARCLGLIALYAVQSVTNPDAWIERYGLSREQLVGGRWATLLTCMFVHIGWMHVLSNAAVAFAFGPPVARLMGTGPRGSVVFFAFYLVCGVIGGLGLVAMDADPRDLSVGASGAISGLLGGAVRLIDRRGLVGPLWSRTAIIFTAVWLVINYVVGAFGLTPGAIGIPVAWQAHMAGFLAGLLLIGPFARLAGRGHEAFTH